jgi:dTDP-4-dehydrorhamnose 3,5-epimerase
MLNGVQVIKYDTYSDNRGTFKKLFSIKLFELQDQFSLQESFITSSIKGTTRGMHIQSGDSANWKIIVILQGLIFDVLTDLRKDSATYMQSYCQYLGNDSALLVPPGIAHGFQSIEESTLLYMSNKLHDPIFDLGFNVNSLESKWPLDFTIQSVRDSLLPSLNEFKNYTFNE